MIKAIAFDLWETLITDTPELSKRQERLRLDRMERTLREGGFGVAAERIEQAYRALWPRCQELYWSSDLDISCRRQIEHLLEGLELDPGWFDEPVLAELEYAYANAALEIPPAVVRNAAPTLQALKARGLAIGMISNTGRTPGYALRAILDRLGLASSIDVMIFSNEHGVCKPQASIFEELLRGLGVAPGELVFVGDNLYADVHGAQRCGIRGVHFTPPVRGTAIAPPVEHDLTIVPDAAIDDLAELPAIVETWMTTADVSA